MWLQPDCFIGKTKAEFFMQKYSKFCEAKCPWHALYCWCENESFRVTLKSVYLICNSGLHTGFSWHHLTQTGCMEFLSGFWYASISCTQHSRVQASHKSHLGNKQLFLSWTLVWFNCGQFRSNLEQFEDASSHQQVVFQTANNLNPLQIP